MTTNSSHLSSETLDLWMLSALEPQEKREAELHISNCQPCAAALKERQEDAAHFTQFVQPRTLNAVVERATRPPSILRWFSSWKMWVPLASAVATALVVVWFAQVETSQEAPYLGIKGMNKPWFEVVVARGENRQFQLKEGDRLLPNDRLEFIVEPVEARHVMVASRDGAGNFSVYYPFQKPTSEKLEPKRQVLPGSVALDHVLGEETLWVIFSNEPVFSSDVKRAMAETAPDALKSANVQTLKFVKVSP